MLFMFFAISNWHRESADKTEELLCLATLSIAAQQAALQDQLSQTLCHKQQSDRGKASVGYVKTFQLGEKGSKLCSRWEVMCGDGRGGTQQGAGACSAAGSRGQC